MMQPLFCKEEGKISRGQSESKWWTPACIDLLLCWLVPLSFSASPAASQQVGTRRNITDLNKVKCGDHIYHAKCPVGNTYIEHPGRRCWRYLYLIRERSLDLYLEETSVVLLFEM